MRDVDFHTSDRLGFCRRLIVLVCGAALLVGIAGYVYADDFQCTNPPTPAGCPALMPSHGGTRTVYFRKGDIIGESSGWIVNESTGGWVEIDGALGSKTWECKNPPGPAGCPASKGPLGAMKGVWLPPGTVVDTADGYIVKQKDGWTPIGTALEEAAQAAGLLP